MEWTNQVIYNILVIKYIDIKVFDYIYPWYETLTYIAWFIRPSYHLTIGYTSEQAVYDKYMVLKNSSIVDRQVLMSIYQRQVNIDN